MTIELAPVVRRISDPVLRIFGQLRDVQGREAQLTLAGSIECHSNLDSVPE